MNNIANGIQFNSSNNRLETRENNGFPGSSHIQSEIENDQINVQLFNGSKTNPFTDMLFNENNIPVIHSSTNPFLQSPNDTDQTHILNANSPIEYQQPAMHSLGRPPPIDVTKNSMARSNQNNVSSAKEANQYLLDTKGQKTNQSSKRMSPNSALCNNSNSLYAVGSSNLENQSKLCCYFTKGLHYLHLFIRQFSLTNPVIGGIG